MQVTLVGVPPSELLLEEETDLASAAAARNAAAAAAARAMDVMRLLNFIFTVCLLLPLHYFLKVVYVF